MTKHLEA